MDCGLIKDAYGGGPAVLLHVPDGSILIGVDELTALVKRSGDDHWVVVGEAKVHVLKGMPDQQLVDGGEIKLTLT